MSQAINTNSQKHKSKTQSIQSASTITQFTLSPNKTNYMNGVIIKTVNYLLTLIKKQLNSHTQVQCHLQKMYKYEVAKDIM
jgi:hypothetical protein